MSKYIDAEKLKAEINRKIGSIENCPFQLASFGEEKKSEGELIAYKDALSLIDSLQQEQLKDKQIIIITESHGDANIEWDCRSLDDVIALLKRAESFITEKQIEKIAGPGSGPDYATTEGRYSHLFKRQQEQPEVDLEKEFNNFLDNVEGVPRMWHSNEQIEWVKEIAKHFYELGLNARKEE